jgi:DNA repair exonuclease SbcCD ATPase subunit
MTVQILNTTKQVDKIYHLADIHIRKNNCRCVEYTEVFNNLYNELKKTNNDNSLIVICGDIYHDGLTTENIIFGKNFFRELAEICDIIVIKGNHDIVSKTNEEIPDCVVSISHKLETKNIIYNLDKTGEYVYGNIIFGHTTIFDDKVYKITSTDTTKIKIGLYHGQINGCATDDNYIFTNSGIFNKTDFDDYDYVLLGDIHKHQYLNKNNTIAYAGSLCQQNYSETINNHGYIEWNLYNKTSTFVNIANSYGFLTLYCNNNNIEQINYDKLPKNINLKIKHKNSNFTYIKSYCEIMKTKVNLLEIVYDNRDIIDDNKNNDNIKSNLFGNKCDLLKYLFDYIKTNTAYNDEDKQLIHDKINTILSTSQIKHKELINFEILSIKFDNFNVYDENNIINYEKLHGIINIGGLNGIGKSSATSQLLLFAMFGSSPRECMNVIKNKLIVDFEFKINNIKYKIVRHHSIKKELKRSNIKHITSLYKNDINITKKNENETHQEIKNILQITENDFIDYCIMGQKDCRSFLAKEPEKQKGYLYNIFKLDIFDKIVNEIGTESKSLSTIMNEKIKISPDNNLCNNIINLTHEHEKITQLLNEQNIIKDKLYCAKILNEQLSNNNLKLLESHDKNIAEYTNITKHIDENNQKILQLENEITLLLKLIINDSDLENINKSIVNINTKINEENKKYNNKKIIKHPIKRLQTNIKNITLQINNILIKQQELQKIKTSYAGIEEKKLKFEQEKQLNILSYEQQLKNIDNIQNNNKHIKQQIENTKKLISTSKKNNSIINNNINKLKSLLITNTLKPIKLTKTILNNFIKYETIINEYNTLNEQEKQLKIILNNYNITLNELKNHIYNTNCEVCMSNNSTKQKINIEAEIKKHQYLYDDIVIKIKNYGKDIKNQIKNHTKKINIDNHNNKIIEIEKNNSHTQKLISDEQLKHNKNSIDIQNNTALLEKLLEQSKMISQYDDINTKLKAERSKIFNEYQAYTELIAKETDYNNQLTKYNNQLLILHNKLNENDENLKLETENTKIQNNITEYKKELKKLESTKNEHDKANKKIYENNIIKLNLINDNNTHSIKQKSLIDMIENVNQLKQNYNEINNNNKLMEYDMCINKVIELSDKLKQLDINIATNNEQIKIYNENKDYINKLNKQISINNHINNIIKNEFIDNIFKNKILVFLNEDINNILNCYTNFNISIEYDNKNIDILKTDPKKCNKTCATRLSGFQTMLVNIAFRIVLNKYNCVFNTNFLILDEVFSFCDKENISKMESLLQYLKTIYKFIIVISHNNQIQTYSNMQLTIKNDKICSHIEFV